MEKFGEFGVGTDIERISRFRNLDPKGDSIFLDKIFTKKEIDFSFSKKDPAQHLAVRYAGKEAVVKALNSLGFPGIIYKEIEIINDKNGIPLININEEKINGIKIEISLSHCTDTVLAFAIAVKGDKYD